MRHALILTLVLGSLGRLDRPQARETLRRAAIGFCRAALRIGSRPYRVRQGPAVIFAPHQDDEAFGCGGLIARKRRDGLPVHVIYVTDGSASHPDHPRVTTAEIGAIRRQEAREVLAVLGVESSSTHFLDEPDGTLANLAADRQASLIGRVAGLLRHIRPDEIFLPCSPDGSSEHDAASALIVSAVQQTGLAPDLWQFPIWAWWNPTRLLQLLLASSDCRRLPAEDFYAVKRQALSHYRSQTEPLPPQTAAALPPELVQTFSSEVEYFFRLNLPRRAPAEFELPVN